MSHEYSSERMARLAARAMTNPHTLTFPEIKALGASVLTQARDIKGVNEQTIEKIREQLDRDGEDHDPGHD